MMMDINCRKDRIQNPSHEAAELIRCQRTFLKRPLIDGTVNRSPERRHTAVLLQHHFIQLCVRLRPDTVVEIGAHEAGFCRQMVQCEFVENVIGFEANPFVFKKFQSKLAALGIDYQNAAVGSALGSAALYIPRRKQDTRFSVDNPIASLKPRNDTGFEYDVVHVHVIPLNTILQGVSARRVATWIDVEGAQSDVLAGIDGEWSRIVAILIELETRPVWMDQWHEEYVNKVLRMQGFVMVMLDAESSIQYNAVYLRTELFSADILSILQCYLQTLDEFSSGKCGIGKPAGL